LLVIWEQVADFIYRQATDADITATAEIRAGDWGTEEYWRERILPVIGGQWPVVPRATRSADERRPLNLDRL
jgi:hypothetical protein